MATMQVNESSLRPDTMETLREIWLNKNCTDKTGEQVSAKRSSYDELFENRLQHANSSDGLKEIIPTAAEWWLAMHKKPSQVPAPIGTRRQQDMFAGDYDTGSGYYAPPGTMEKALPNFESSTSALSFSTDRTQTTRVSNEVAKDSCPSSYTSPWEPSTSSLRYSTVLPSPPCQSKSSLILDSGGFHSFNATGDTVLSRLNHFSQEQSRRRQCTQDQLQHLEQQQLQLQQKFEKKRLELERRKNQLEASDQLYKLINSVILEDGDDKTVDLERLEKLRLLKQLLGVEFNAVNNQRKNPLATNPLSLELHQQHKNSRQQQQRSVLSELLRSRMAMLSQGLLVTENVPYLNAPLHLKSTKQNTYEEALESLENEAKSRRTLACVKNATLTWKGVLTTRHHDSPTYASKVFVGGLPYDVTSDVLAVIFGKFGASVQLPPRGRGHAYLVFENELQVQTLLKCCELEDDEKFYFWVPSKRGKDRKAQVIPWAIEDSDWLSPDCAVPVPLATMSEPSSTGSRSLRSTASDASSHESTSSLVEELTDDESLLSSERISSFQKAHSDINGFSKQNTVFVGALHGEITAEDLQRILSELFGPIIHVGIDTDKNRYPNGSARVTFASTSAFRAAVLAEYVQVVTPRFSKTIQLDAYIEDGTCCVCDVSTPVFCRHPDCFRYYCATCFNKHRLHNTDYHPPVMRNRHSGTFHTKMSSVYFSNNSTSLAKNSPTINSDTFSLFITGINHFHTGLNAAS